jgi:hypothetical protein
MSTRWQEIRSADFRNGSRSVFDRCPRHFRFAHNRDQIADIALLPRTLSGFGPELTSGAARRQRKNVATRYFTAVFRAKNQSIKTDLTTALAMACLAATERSSHSAYRLDVFDENFRDEDLPPLPEPELPTRPQANADWWKGQARPQPTSSADERMRNMYGALDNAIQWGLIK